MADTRSLRAQPEKPETLQPDDIKYLVFEGGGGKGFAYLGAIEVLESLKVIERVQGFAGASAGAITALLLSLGMKKADIENYMLHTDFNQFFDPVTPRKRPLPGVGVEPVEDNETERELLAMVQTIATQIGVVTFLVGGGFATLALEKRVTLGQLVKALVDKKIAGLPAPFPQLIRDWAKYLVYLPRDMGLFSGEAARSEFDRLIREYYAKKTHSLPSAVKSVTFSQHYQAFGKRLLLSGTNLRSGRTQLFSDKHTPDFPVADAVRISMGLPWIYKPYVIEKHTEGWPECGVYVDGGVWNNLPYREFDAEGAQDAPTSSLRSSQKKSRSKRQTLGLRLAVDPLPEVTSVFALSWQMLLHGLTGSGETQVLDQHVSQTIVLDTEGLDLINFSPPEAVRTKVVRRAKRTAMRYFGRGDLIDVDPDLRDEQDDMDSYVRRMQASSCEPVDVDALRAELRRAGLLGEGK